MNFVRKMAAPAAVAALLVIGAQTAFALSRPVAGEIYAASDASYVKRGFHLGGFYDYDYFVEQGVIDQATADKIADYQLEKQIAAIDEQKAELEKLKAMTREERTSYFETKKAELSEKFKAEDKKIRPNPMDDLVADGIITQETADAIKAALPEKIRTFEGKEGRESKESKEGFFKIREAESSESSDL